MALWQGHLTHAEREAVAGTKPLLAYFMLDPGASGRYVLGTGNPLTEQAAFLKSDPIASALERFTLDDNRAEEDRTMALVSATKVVV